MRTTASRPALPPELEAFVDQASANGRLDDAIQALTSALDLLRSGHQSPSSRPWLVGGGECGDRMRMMDWRGAGLPAPDTWPCELVTTVTNIVNSPVAKVLMWGDDAVLFYNDAYREILGDRHPAGLGRPAAQVLPEMWDWTRAVLERTQRGEVVSHRDQPMVMQRASGPETFYLHLFYTPVYLGDGRVGGTMCTIVDNSARLLAERRLAGSEAELRRISDAVPMFISYVDRCETYRFVNAAYERWFGTAREQMLGRTIGEVAGEAFAEERRQAIARALAGDSFINEVRIPRADGQTRLADVRYTPHVEPDGSIPGVYILGIDVEERAEREAALAASNMRFRTAMEAVHGVLWTNSSDGRMLGEQPGWGALTGQSFDEYQGFGWSTAVHPDDRAATITAWRAAVDAKRMFVHEHRVRQHDGIWRTFAIRALPILDRQREIVEWIGVHTDITHRRAAEAALREQAEALQRQVRHRERAEEQLRQLNLSLEARVIAEIDERRRAEAKLIQAQKMDAIGKLTGGVAHDFNNLLQVVSGNLQLLQKDVAGNPRAERRIANALAGVSRGAKLASQLLAFGRRQALEPKVVNVTRFVRGMDDMLRQAIGEAIEIETVFGGGLWNTFVDPVQIENAVLNLAINARDAMNGTGRLTIELANTHLDDHYARTHEDVLPGQYVMLAVSDTGSGMSPDIVAKVFEPFFSTKGEGKGSGLGLSMVYGFVKQSGGHVKIYSEVGHGTTIKLFLPRATETEDREVAIDTGPIAGGTETVLVVEDDAEVRATVVEILSELGYRVLKAVDATSALHVIESGIPIDMLFTDVVMPGPLKSPELARKARERLPDVAVLFTSGYTENSIVHGGKLDAGVELLSKPYTREALARKFRHVLANQRQRRLAPPATKPQDATSETRIPASVPTPAPADEGRSGTVLLVEDDALIRINTAEMLKDAGYAVIEAGSAEEALIALQTAPVDILVTDVNLPGATGQQLAARARDLRPATVVVFATGDSALVEAGNRTSVLGKPYDAAMLMDAIAMHGRSPQTDVAQDADVTRQAGKERARTAPQNDGTAEPAARGRVGKA